MAEYKLVLLYAKWCGHCQRFNPSTDNNSSDLTWAKVKAAVKTKINCHEFEEGDLETDHTGYDIDSIKDATKGWPTLLFLVKEKDSEKFKPHVYFEGNRSKIEDFHEAISQVTEGKVKSILLGGSGLSSNKYRLKYKKYKQLYANIMKKYKELKIKQ